MKKYKKVDKYFLQHRAQSNINGNILQFPWELFAGFHLLVVSIVWTVVVSQNLSIDSKILSKERENKKHKMLWEEIALKDNLRSSFMWSKSPKTLKLSVLDTKASQ